MRKNKGFTLIELMVVILIVAILAAVLAPMLTGRIQEAKWTEGKTGAGTIATALRAYVAENEGWTNDNGSTFAVGTALTQLGLTDGDLEGKYFEADCYSITTLGAYNPAAVPMITYTITVTGANGKTGHPSGTRTLDQTGTWGGT